MIITQKDLEKFENGTTWRRCSAKVRNDNPICQFCDPATGEQCHAPSRIVHHLVDPRDCNEAALAVSNLVACCFNHHPGGHRGDLGKANYAPTRESVGFGQPDVYHIHKTAEQLKTTTTTQPPHVWANLAAQERIAAQEWAAWKAKRQSTPNPDETSNTNTEATDTQ